jgi:hypothetical protein
MVVTGLFKFTQPVTAALIPAPGDVPCRSENEENEHSWFEQCVRLGTQVRTMLLSGLVLCADGVMDTGAVATTVVDAAVEAELIALFVSVHEHTSCNVNVYDVAATRPVVVHCTTARGASVTPLHAVTADPPAGVC